MRDIKVQKLVFMMLSLMKIFSSIPIDDLVFCIFILIDIKNFYNSKELTKKNRWWGFRSYNDHVLHCSVSIYGIELKNAYCKKATLL